ncbi:MAG: hypothetical protein SFY56_07420 [Bacteroidota bacterium]|nr:hypothetical protein [Bacteroidota bacterium]
MALDKVLNKLKVQIKDLTPTMELFADETIHPSVKDCEQFKEQLIALQESLAIYKYQKLDKEISPSFNIHAKVSEKEIEAVKPIINDLKEENKVSVVEKTIETKAINPSTQISDEKYPTTHHKKLNIGLNDKFRFINELFKQNNTEYNVVFEQLNSLKTWNECEFYLNSLKDVYEWKSTDDTVKYFYSIAKKRFD